MRQFYQIGLRITYKQHRNGIQSVYSADRSNFTNPEIYIGNIVKEDRPIRITSYNVCYTKLLRGIRSWFFFSQCPYPYIVAFTHVMNDKLFVGHAVEFFSRNRELPNKFVPHIYHIARCPQIFQVTPVDNRNLVT